MPRGLRVLLLLAVGLALAPFAPARADLDDWPEAPVRRASAPISLWDVYRTPSPDRATLDLAMEPDRTVVKVGTELRFATRVGAEGWVVIVEHGTSGRVHVLFPTPATAAMAKVSAGQVIHVPDRSDQAYAPDSPGLERMQALWFGSADGASALLAGLEAAGATGSGAEVARIKSSLAGRTYGGAHCSSHLIVRVTP